ncbi:MAG: hypothetical protein M3Z66_08020 [Chloroflexota bacterium]|nr:hypothetical protein [Chloroflexota bacterium]
MDREPETEADFNEDAGTGALIADNPSDLVDDSPENPTVSGLTAGGTGTAIDTGLSEAGGATGSGGGMVGRIGGHEVAGGTSSGTLWSGTGMPPKPKDPEEDE